MYFLSLSSLVMSNIERRFFLLRLFIILERNLTGADFDHVLGDHVCGSRVTQSPKQRFKLQFLSNFALWKLLVLLGLNGTDHNKL